MCGGNDQEYSGPKVEAICGNCGYTFSYPIPCGDLTCEERNKRRKRDIIERLTPIIETWIDPHFLTLTVKSRRLSREEIRTLRRNLGKLRHRSVWLSVFGGFYNIEVGTLDENGICNMHIHVLYDGIDMEQSYLSWVWYQITGDSFIVDIRRCWSVQGALHYLSKHFCKIGNFEGENSRNLINKSLKNTRLVQGFGKTIKNRACFVGDKSGHELIFLAPSRMPPPLPVVCPECHAIGSFYSAHDPLYYDILSAFDDLEYDRCPA